MLKEKIKELFIKLAVFIAAGVLTAGLVLFAVKTFWQKSDTSLFADAAKDKKAPPVEIKGTISEGISKKKTESNAKRKREQETTDDENTLVTIIPTDPQETAEPENSQETLENEATLAPSDPDIGDSSTDMTATLEGQIQDIISSQYTAGGTVAVCAGRISDGLSLVNNHSMQAASLIKLFVAGCMYETMGDTSQYEPQISSMISASDNTACNSLVAVLGGGDAQAGMSVINEYCMNHGFTETHIGRLMLQPNDQDDNYTSVQDCGNFLLEIYNGSLAGSNQILQYMKQQERRGKIPAGVPSGIETANKTGELDFVENDAAIVFHPSGAYVLCVMSENLSDAYSSRLFINTLSEMVYCLMG